MRPLGIVVSLVALGALVGTLAQLGATLNRLRTLELPAARIDPVKSEMLETVAPAANAARQGYPSELEPTKTASSDEHIMRALIADTELQRAAAELLQDPDPAVRADAQQFMLELGVPSTNVSR